MSSSGEEKEVSPLIKEEHGVSETESEKPKGQRWPKLFRGVGTAVCITMIIASWITMTKLLQDASDSYDRPFFLSYFIHSHYAVFYIVWKLWRVFPGNLACNEVGEGKLTNFKALAIATGVLSIFSYSSGAFWYLSLSRTSISANTAIYQSSSAAVFIMSIPVLRERVSLMKVMSVAVTVAGVSLISVFENGNSTAPSNHTLSNFLEKEEAVTPAERNTPLGYVYVVLSVILYAMLEVGYKKFATKEDDPAPIQNSVRGLGYIGVHTLLWAWPLLIILHFTGLETFELPELKIYRELLINVALDLVFNVSFYTCITLSSPLITSVGSVLVIPTSVVVDWVANNYILPWAAILGIISICSGFFFLVFSEAVETFYWHKAKNSSNFGAAEQSSATGITQVNTKTKKRKRRYLYYII